MAKVEEHMGSLFEKAKANEQGLADSLEVLETKVEMCPLLLVNLPLILLALCLSFVSNFVCYKVDQV